MKNERDKSMMTRNVTERIYALSIEHNHSSLRVRRAGQTKAISGLASEAARCASEVKSALDCP
jgi:hypothetical protein